MIALATEAPATQPPPLSAADQTSPSLAGSLNGVPPPLDDFSGSPAATPKDIVKKVIGSKLLAAALDLADRSISVFPCNGKKPFTAHGLHEATTDPAIIRQWWSKWPLANIGLPTGKVNGLVVVDVDGPQGQASLEALTGEHGALPLTLEVITGKGRHFYFQHPGQQIRNSTAKLGPGLDIRGDGGYVIAPPSVHQSGKRYEWKNSGTAPAPIPGWIVDLLNKPKPKPAAAPALAPALHAAASNKYAAAALIGELNKVSQAPEGQRNHTLNQAAFALGQFVGAGLLVEQTVEDELLAAAIAAGLDGHEAYPTIKSGLSAGMKEPRQIPVPIPSWAAQTIEAGDDPSSAGQANNDKPRLFFGLHDVGNGQRFAAQYASSVHYCPQHKEASPYYVWDGKRWKRDEGCTRVELLAKKTAASIYIEASKANDQERAEEICDWAHNTHSRGRIDAMIDLARSEPGLAVDIHQFDANPDFLNVQNGILNLQTYELLPHDRNALCTKIAAAAYLPDAECPLWHQALHLWHQGNEAVMAYLQRFSGLCLTGQSEKVLPFYYGPLGNNGKSTFCSTLVGILGDYGLPKVDLYALLGDHKGGNSPDRADLLGVRLAILSETEKDKPLGESTLRDLTGGVDHIAACRKYEAPIRFKPTAKLVMFGNFRPILRGTDDALWARIHALEWGYQVPAANRDPSFADKLRAEYAGILAWAVEGLKEYRQVGLAPPPEVQDATNAYRQSLDTLNKYITEECTLAQEFQTPAGKLMEAYRTWCKANGHQPVSPEDVRLGLERQGVKNKHTKTGNFYLGIGLPARLFDHGEDE